MAMRELAADDPQATAIVAAIREGKLDELKRILNESSDLASARIRRDNTPSGGVSRTLLHVATDWPGHFPNNPETVRELIARGADVNARCSGNHTETPLHWAASSDDVAVLDVLLDHGADIEAPGAVIGGGAPLADAVAFGQWKAARRLIERGARTTLWQAAALGLMPRVEAFFAARQKPGPEDVTNAFWCACHGGQRETAKYLLAHGADMNWIGHDGLTPLDAAARSEAAGVAEWLRERGARSRADTQSTS